jgi:hypothetical protein
VHCIGPATRAPREALATAATLIETAKLNDVDPHAWLTDTRARIDELLPWSYGR